MIFSRFEAVRNPNRLAAVRATGLLDSPREAFFDRLTRLTSAALHAPIALISLADAEREFLKSSVGLPEPWTSRREIPLSHSFCWLVIATGERLIVADARQDPLLASSPAVRELGIVAYAGLPLAVADGPVLGVVGLADRQPRDWTDDETRILADVTGLVADEIGRRLASRGTDEQKGTAPEWRGDATLLDVIGQGVCRIDRAGQCTYVNRTGARLLGYHPSELLDRDWHDLVHHSRDDGSPCDRGTCHLTRALADPRAIASGDDVFWRRDLSRLPVAYTVVPLDEIEDHDGVALIFSDVTETRRIEEQWQQRLAEEGTARRDAETAYRRQAFLAQLSALTSTELDAKAAATTIAQLTVPFLADWSAVDLVEEGGVIRRVAASHVDPTKVTIVRDLLTYVPENEGRPLDPRRIVATGQAEITLEVPDRELLAWARGANDLARLRAIGTRSIICVPLIAHGRTLGALTVALGPSGRLYRPGDGLFVEELARHAALAIANARLYEEAVDAVRVRNELLVSVTHDLKNPLANIKGYTQLLLRNVRQLGSPDTADLIAWLTRIDATTTKMDRLLEELLDAARQQTSPSIELQHQPTDLVALAHQVAEVYQQTTERTRIRVETAMPSLVGMWDALRLERVLSNLVSNAIKYSGDGGDVTIGVATEESGGRACAVVTVRDEGVGIPTSDLPHVFERFYRARNVAGQSSGVGIGLASVRKIVEQHGGTVSVTSQEGVGTVFTVRLPLTGSPVPGANNRTSRGAGPA